MFIDNLYSPVFVSSDELARLLGFLDNKIWCNTRVESVDAYLSETEEWN